MIDQVVDLAVTGIADLRDPGAHLDQAPQHRAVGDDLGVVTGVGRGRNRLGEGVQVRGAADPGGLAALGQFGVDRDGVDRFPAGEEVDHTLIDDLVRWAIEVRGADDLDDLADGVLGQEHATQDTLLRLDVVRWGALVPALFRWLLSDTHELLPTQAACAGPDRTDPSRMPHPRDGRAPGGTLWTRLYHHNPNPGGHCAQRLCTSPVDNFAISPA